MSRNSSLLSVNRKGAKKPKNKANSSVLHYKTIKREAERLATRAYAEQGRNLPKGVLCYESKSLAGIGILAMLTARLPSGTSASYGELSEVYSSSEEAKKAVYQRAKDMGIMEFLESELLSEQKSLSPPASAPTDSSSSSSSTSKAEPSAVSAAPSDTPSTAPPDSDLPGTSLAGSPPSSTQPLTTPHDPNTTLNESTDAPPKVEIPIDPLPATQSSLVTGALSMVFGLFSGVAANLKLPLHASPLKGTKRARSDEAADVPTDMAQPAKKLKATGGASYRTILADHCQEFGRSHPIICHQQCSSGPGGSGAAKYRMLGIMGRKNFELPGTCDCTEVGEEMLSKLILEGLGVNTPSASM